MHSAKLSWSINLVLVFISSVPLSAVTVNPALCPTNKIAPHRHVKRWDWEYQPRTLGAFYDLLAPGGSQGYDPNLQEEPQKDESDDCGDIEDYDEHDLSSLTPINQYRGQYSNDGRRFFFGLFNGGQGNRPEQQPQYPPNRPQVPQRPQYPQPQYPQIPQKPIKPPYNSGGYFQNNPYRPPIVHQPSDEVKPVHEGVSEPQTTYKPHVVGGPTGHVVGVTPVSIRPPPYRLRPTYQPGQITRSPPGHTTEGPSYDRYPQYTTRRPRPRQFNGDDSILGSFIDLLFR